VVWLFSGEAVVDDSDGLTKFQIAGGWRDNTSCRVPNHRTSAFGYVLIPDREMLEILPSATVNFVTSMAGSNSSLIIL
jgi:hypothetical protein